MVIKLIYFPIIYTLSIHDLTHSYTANLMHLKTNSRNQLENFKSNVLKNLYIKKNFFFKKKTR